MREKISFSVNNQFEGYGMTELSTIGLIIPISELSKSKFGSVGVPLANSLCKVFFTVSYLAVGM